MDTSRVSLGEMIAAAGGLALLVVMFLPWFGGKLSGLGAPVRVPSETGWESFGGVLKFVLIACAVIAIGMAVARAMDSSPALPVEQGVLVLSAGVLAVLIVGIRLLDAPDVVEVSIPNLQVETSRKVGAFLGLRSEEHTSE